MSESPSYVALNSKFLADSGNFKRYSPFDDDLLSQLAIFRLTTEGDYPEEWGESNRWAILRVEGDDPQGLYDLALRKEAFVVGYDISVEQVTEKGEVTSADIKGDDPFDKPLVQQNQHQAVENLNNKTHVKHTVIAGADFVTSMRVLFQKEVTKPWYEKSILLSDLKPTDA